MHVVVIGAGAVGGYFGGRLAAQGTSVTFLVREKRYEQLAEDGLQVQSTHGDFTIRPHLAKSFHEIEQPDIVIVALKNYHLHDALPQIRGLVEKGAIILPLLNGVRHIDVLVSEFGQASVVGGACYIEATLNEKGHVIHTSPMHDVIFGSLTGSTEQQTLLGKLEAAFLESGVPAQNSTSILVEMWRKFIFLTSFSGITAATRKPIGDILGDEQARPFMEDVIKEIVAVAKSQIEVPSGVVDEIMKRLHSISPSMTSSLHRDLEKGLPLEIDSLQGAVIEMATSKDILVPCVRAVYAVLHPWKNGSHGDKA